MKEPTSIIVTELIPQIDSFLIELLRDIEDEDWNKPTMCVLWTVKDIVAHLLDGNIRRLSSQRDQYLFHTGMKDRSFVELTEYVNQLNADWVKAAARISPQLLIQLLEITGAELGDFFKTLDPYGTATFPVAWAGEKESRNWFDLAREYTEKWLHQQHIREAVNKPGLVERAYYFPVLDTFMRALPYTYDDAAARKGTLLKFRITGAAGGEWFLLRKSQKWDLLLEVEEEPDSTVTIPQEIAWKLFSKGMSQETAEKQIEIEGDAWLGRKVLGMVAVMA